MEDVRKAKTYDCKVIFPSCQILRMTAIGNNEFNVEVRALLGPDHTLFTLVPEFLANYDALQRKAELYDKCIADTEKNLIADNVVIDTRVTMPKALYDELTADSIRFHQMLRNQEKD